ncbi:MAG: ABC transporter ATP-binding protein/permease [Rhodobacteraceae bacterium]|nr:ABC transporter ATP-binding protein/permease [Paracoccaceae bacterium]
MTDQATEPTSAGAEAGKRAAPGPQASPPDEGKALRIVTRVVPYLWPRDEPAVRLRVAAALVLLLAAKLIAVATPFFYKAAVDRLSGVERDDVWLMGLGAVGLTVAYGMSRILNTGFQEARDATFARVGQRALRAVALETFTHIHRMSLRYHITRKTGGLSRIMERGVKGVAFLLRMVLLSLGPLIFELTLVGIILATLFDIRYLFVVAGTMVLYFAFTFRVTEWRVGIRREMNRLDTDANQKAIDSLLNFETVKYFGAEAREARRYDAAMEGFSEASVKTAYSLAMLNFGQTVIMTGGLVTVMAMAAIGVRNGTLTVGDFVMVNAYMIQITMPLNLLGMVYREIRQSLIDMGEMFDLLDQPAEIADRPGAPALDVADGRVSFDDVRFAYDPARPILKGISFEVPPGRSLALVGPSGAGKSTIARLLFRFYDVTGGAIRIDGQDVRAVTQDSLHDAIGIVPQDTVLFNDTILYNIAYGREGASRGEVEAAAMAARLHEFIASLPEGYDTQVGERGLKLSGGEKQRVGIARTLLKNPPIVVLDEATSALDTRTERDIQESLRAISRGRTVITIAHRLSTVVDADEIIVLEDGRVAERGTHASLLARSGLYAGMWRTQAEAERRQAAT